MEMHEIRKALGISQNQLADAAGVPRSAVANVEAGRYLLSAAIGIDLFMALIDLAGSNVEQRAAAKAEALKCLELHKQRTRIRRLGIEGQIRQLKKKIADVEQYLEEMKELERRLIELV